MADSPFGWDATHLPEALLCITLEQVQLDEQM